MSSPHYSNSFFEQNLVLTDKYKNRNRFEVFREFCHGKRVLHVGFADWPITDINNNLHVYLDGVCKALDGFDTNVEAFPLIQAHVKGKLFSDVNKIFDSYDLVIVPEVIEHVGNVENFLESLNQLKFDEILFTAPDAVQCYSRHFRVLNDGHFSELVHPDHNCWYSPYNLYNTIRKYSPWEIFELGAFNDISIILRAKKESAKIKYRLLDTLSG
ncbi:hypothetical protein [Acidithiobacillus sp. AMEEHan]|uniref:hypothetical protein n=1 Tax=Acidithiobacillus sp. AMEEHan TaxID=2994951 RepID=UPI0027E4175B|nr:hypothetical protein [Acidithiobacillus sp. AMEEHan]